MMTMVIDATVSTAGGGVASNHHQQAVSLATVAGDGCFQMQDLRKNCEDIMNGLTGYDERVVRGLIVQVFYWALSFDIIRELDEELTVLAAEYSGHPTSEQGWSAGRRDIDFEFSDASLARQFASTLVDSTIRFYVHEHLNNLGQLLPKPTLYDIELRRAELKRVNCNENNLC